MLQSKMLLLISCIHVLGVQVMHELMSEVKSGIDLNLWKIELIKLSIVQCINALPVILRMCGWVIAIFLL